MESRPELLRQLLLLEWEYRSEQGKRIDAAREFARFPGFAVAVREAFEEHQRADQEDSETGQFAGTPPGWQARRETGFEIFGRLGQGGISSVLWLTSRRKTGWSH